MTTKKALRRTVEQARTQRPAVALDEVVAPLVARAGKVASFVGFGAEPYVTPQPGWLLPVLLPDDDLDWAEYDGTLAPGRRGLREPTGPRLGVDAVAGCDLVLVPALLVDRSGTRLGKGGGSYDRALARATGLTVALLHDGELVEHLPREVHDVPVAAVATPALGVVRLSGKM